MAANCDWEDSMHTSFHETIFSHSIVHKQMPDCNPAQHKEVEDIYSPYDDFHAAAKLYTPPCTQMSSIVTINEDIARFDDQNITSLILKFEYPLDYKEMVNKKEFNVYELWSQIGGIVGIIIGYSLMQIPETLELIFIHIKRRIRPSFTQESTETKHKLDL